MDAEESLPRKVLFQKQRTIVPKHSQNFGEPAAFDKGDILSNKAKVQFEHDLEASLRSFEKEMHQQRLENLRHLADKLKEDAWRKHLFNSSMASEGKIVLSYQNSSLRESDVALLSAPNWLNDNIISFWFEYLENTTYKDDAQNVAFVCPQVVQCMKCIEQEDVKMMVDSLQLDKKQLVFLPINDSISQTRPGGSHWSVLMFNARTKTFEHYDSFSSSNNTMQAKNVARVLQPFLDPGSSFDSIRFCEMDCPQQANSYDCGVHVICNTDALCRIYLKNDNRPLSVIAPPNVVGKARDKLKALICSLKHK